MALDVAGDTMFTRMFLMVTITLLVVLFLSGTASANCGAQEYWNEIDESSFGPTAQPAELIGNEGFIPLYFPGFVILEVDADAQSAGACTAPPALVPICDTATCDWFSTNAAVVISATPYQILYEYSISISSFCSPTSSSRIGGFQFYYAGTFFGATSFVQYSSSCSLPPPPPPPPPPPCVPTVAKADLLNGDNQTGNTLGLLALPLAIKTCPGTSVTFTITQTPSDRFGHQASGASLATNGFTSIPPYTTSLSIMADDSGNASTPFVPGDLVGQYQVTVYCSSCDPSAGPVSVTFAESAQCGTAVPDLEPWDQSDGYPGHWGGDQYAFHDDGEPTTMKHLGCGTTALAIALNAKNVSAVPIIVSLPPGPSVPTTEPLDPGTLNTFMVQQGPNRDYNNSNDPVWDPTTRDISKAVGIPLKFDATKYGSTSIHDLAAQICAGNPVIVAVQSPTHVDGTHKVVVDGMQDNGDGTMSFSITDPGFQRYESLDDYFNLFSIVGFVTDPDDLSGIDLDIDENADILIKDQIGRSTGHDLVRGTQVNDIPSSGYLSDFVTDNFTELPVSPLSHGVQILQPAMQTFEVQITGVNTGQYTLIVAPFSQDGSRQNQIIVNGLTNAGSLSTYQLTYDPTGATPPQVGLAPGSQGPVPNSQVIATASGLAYSRVAQSFNGTVTLTNIGSTNVDGPVQLVLTGLPAGVTLANESGLWNSIPFITAPNITTLAPGETVNIPVRFKNSSSGPITFTPVVYSGQLQ